jgi:hypothetical protein
VRTNRTEVSEAVAARPQTTNRSPPELLAVLTGIEGPSEDGAPSTAVLLPYVFVFAQEHVAKCLQAAGACKSTDDESKRDRFSDPGDAPPVKVKVAMTVEEVPGFNVRCPVFVSVREVKNDVLVGVQSAGSDLRGTFELIRLSQDARHRYDCADAFKLNQARAGLPPHPVTVSTGRGMCNFDIAARSGHKGWPWPTNHLVIGLTTPTGPKNDVRYLHSRMICMENATVYTRAASCDPEPGAVHLTVLCCLPKRWVRGFFGGSLQGTALRVFVQGAGQQGQPLGALPSGPVQPDATDNDLT